MRNIVVPAVILLAFPILAQPLAAQRGGGFGGGPMMELDFDQDYGLQFAKRLKLTDTQKDQIRELNQKFRKAHKKDIERFTKFRDAIRKRRDEGREMSRDEMRNLINYYGNPMRKIFPAFQRLRQDIRKTLTEEQQAEWDKLMRRERRRAREGGPFR